MAVLGLFLVAVIRMSIAVSGVFRVIAVAGTVVLVQLLGFAPVVAFAGNEGSDGQGEQREKFHCALK